MADKTFWFPSQSGTYDLPSGKTLQIKIWYSNASTVNVDTNAYIVDLGALDIPFEVQDSQQFRLAAWKVTFENTNNIFETQAIVTDSKRKETYMSFIVDGSEIWRGMVVHENYKKENFYNDGSGLVYKQATIEAYDVLYYFWLNDDTLSDASYSDEMVFGTLIDNIFSLVGFSAANVVIDSNITVDEPRGVSYDLDDLAIADFGSNMLVRTFLMHLFLDLAALIYNIDGKMYLTSRVAGSTQAISDDDMIFYDEFSNDSRPEYIEIKATIDWLLTGEVEENEHLKSYGTQGQNSRDYLIDGNNFLERIYYPITTGSTYFGGCAVTTPSDGDTNYLDDIANDFYGEEIETGMILEYNCNLGTPSNLSPIVDVEYNAIIPVNKVYIVDHVLVDYTKDYRIYRKVNRAGWGDNRNYKIELLCTRAISVYQEFFHSSPLVRKMQLYGVDTYKFPYKRYSYDGNNYRARKIRIFIDTDMVEHEFVEVT